MFAYPWMFMVLVAVLFVFYWLMRRRWVSDAFAQEKHVVRQRRLRVLLVLSRTLIFVLIFAALAQPFFEVEQYSARDPELLVLIDESDSMSVLDTSRVAAFLDELRAAAPVRVRTISQGQRSALGDAILSHLGLGENVLLISDGHVTHGASLSDVAFFASTLNATVNAVRLPVAERDAAVVVVAPQKAVEGVDVEFEVRISKTHTDPVPLRVQIDDRVVFNDFTSETSFVFAESFDAGQYRVSAALLEDDFFAQNNQFTHTLTVVERPRIAYVSSKPSGLQQILEELYTVDVLASIPADLSPYYAVILNDLPISAIRDQAALQEFVTAGNGLFVVGGPNSFDVGGYRGSVLETLLPVRIGTGTPNLGGANIVVAIDMSGSTLGSVEWERTGVGEGRFVEATGEVRSLQRALAISLIEELNPSNNLGVLGFTYPLQWSPYGCTGACVIRDIERIGQNKPEITQSVARVNMSGATQLVQGLEGSWQMLTSVSGSRNIIFISNVIGSSQQDRENALRVAARIAQQGGRVYAVQVGDSEMGAEFMRRLAQAGGGAYFHATQANRLSVLFGEPVDIDQGDAFDIFVLDQHHFITQDLDVNAVLYGYNQVIPKIGSRLLLTSIGGDPALTVWNFGVGRVAALTAFDGNDLGTLLSAPSSKVLSRSVNWLIGDPERKNTLVVDVADGFVDEPVSVIVSSESAPVSDELSFSALGAGRYSATITPDGVGVFSVLGSMYAVNYPREFARVGMNPRLEQSLGEGLVFELDEVSAIVEHVKTQQGMFRIEQVRLDWWLLLAALIMFVLEVVVRRVWLRR